MKIDELMTRDAVTVEPGASLKDVARVLAGHRISGVPVCDAQGAVLGVVTEADILWKVRGIEPGHGLLERLLDRAYGDGERVDALTAGDAMSTPAVTIGSQQKVAQAAELMMTHRVNRLPVVDQGRLVGVVARADLVRAFTRTDEEIENEIRDDVLWRTLWIDPDSITFSVSNGAAFVSGEVENRTTAELVEHYVLRVPGVTSVTSELRWQVDDRSRRTAAMR